MALPCPRSPPGSASATNPDLYGLCRRPARLRRIWYTGRKPGRPEPRIQEEMAQPLGASQRYHSPRSAFTLFASKPCQKPCDWTFSISICQIVSCDIQWVTSGLCPFWQFLAPFNEALSEHVARCRFCRFGTNACGFAKSWPLWAQWRDSAERKKRPAKVVGSSRSHSPSDAIDSQAPAL